MNVLEFSGLLSCRLRVAYRLRPFDRRPAQGCEDRLPSTIPGIIVVMPFN